ncbi:unannotated protein [freshwater metagenome]|uniref:Unannotated protein n=1 Tax=freshwater metagenome TaxID=449393 RepID=A0A6J7VUF2_9ZZZZ
MTALSIAASISASAKIMCGFFPPSSRANFLTVSAAACIIVWPVVNPPVKETKSTRGSLMSRDPTTEPGPKIKFATPFGVPASSIIFINAIAL